MIRKIIEIILITFFQIFSLIILCNILNPFDPIRNKEVGFGITVFYTEMIFLILIFTFNSYIKFYNKNIYIIGFIFLIITSVLPIMAIDYRPFRSLFLIFLITIGFISSILISKWRSENKLEPKINFYIKIENYFNDLSENRIPSKLLAELVNQITNTEYDNYERFWNKFPKSRKRYSKLKIEDLDHPFIKYQIIDFFKNSDFENYERYSLILLKMSLNEFKDYEIKKLQYETK